jgi:mRNA interferase RelE/StbE
VYRITADARLEICEVWAIGARADAEVYMAAAARVAAARPSRPEIVQLTRIIERLGRLAGNITVEPTAKTREPVPDWLADRLIHSAGMAREAVAALELREAVDLWAAFSSKPPES